MLIKITFWIQEDTIIQTVSKNSVIFTLNKRAKTQKILKISPWSYTFLKSAWNSASIDVSYEVFWRFLKFSFFYCWPKIGYPRGGGVKWTPNAPKFFLWAIYDICTQEKKSPSKTRKKWFPGTPYCECVYVGRTVTITFSLLS